MSGNDLSRYGGVVVLTAAAALLLGGCGIVVAPGRVPLQQGGLQDLAGVSLEVASAGNDASPYKILNDRGENVGLTADRQQWTKQLAEALAEALARRGAAVRVGAATKLTLSVDTITIAQAGSNFRFNIKTTAATSGGWSKEYTTTAETDAATFESLDRMTKRLAGQALAGAIKAMLDDYDFLTKIGKQPAT